MDIDWSTGLNKSPGPAIEVIGDWSSRWLILKLPSTTVDIETIIDPRSFASTERFVWRELSCLYDHAQKLMNQGYKAFIRDCDGELYVLSDSEKTDTFISLGLPENICVDRVFTGFICIEGKTLEKLGYLEHLNDIRNNKL